MARRNPFQREADRELTARLYCQGRTQVEIAAVIGVDRSVISDDLKIIQKRWLDASVQVVDQAKAAELAKVDHLERTYWDAWLKSCGEKQVKTVAQKGIEEAGKSQKPAPEIDKRASLRTETRDGDPRFLEGVRWCIEKRCKILGLDAPTKDKHEYEFTGLSNDELIRLAKSVFGGGVEAPGTTGSADQLESAPRSADPGL